MFGSLFFSPFFFLFFLLGEDDDVAFLQGNFSGSTCSRRAHIYLKASMQADNSREESMVLFKQWLRQGCRVFNAAFYCNIFGTFMSYQRKACKNGLKAQQSISLRKEEPKGQVQYSVWRFTI